MTAPDSSGFAHDDPRWNEVFPVGTKVILGKHKMIHGNDYWSPKMDQYVGKVATIKEPATDPTGAVVARVDGPGSGHAWRLCNMKPSRLHVTDLDAAIRELHDTEDLDERAQKAIRIAARFDAPLALATCPCGEEPFLDCEMPCCPHCGLAVHDVGGPDEKSTQHVYGASWHDYAENGAALRWMWNVYCDANPGSSTVTIETDEASLDPHRFSQGSRVELLGRDGLTPQACELDGCLGTVMDGKARGDAEFWRVLVQVDDKFVTWWRVDCLKAIDETKQKESEMEACPCCGSEAKISTSVSTGRCFVCCGKCGYGTISAHYTPGWYETRRVSRQAWTYVVSHFESRKKTIQVPIRGFATNTKAAEPRTSSTEKKETNMQKIIDSSKHTLRVAERAIKRGAKAATADEARQLVVNQFRALLGDRFPDEFYATPLGQGLIDMGVCFAVHTAAGAYPQVPGAQTAAEAAGLAMECVARDKVQPFAAMGREMLEGIASSFRSIEGAQDVVPVAETASTPRNPAVPRDSSPVG